MGKIVKFRRRGPLPEVEARLAYLSEELTLTATFTDAMIRTGNYRAAVGVIDEQRTRLAAAETNVVRAFALPTRKRRTHAALAGLAAVLVIGSASFAALGLHSHQNSPKAPQVIEQAEQSLTEAQAAGSTAKVNEAVIRLDAIGAALAAPNNQAFENEVHNFLDRQLLLIKTQENRNGHSMDLIVKKIEELRNKIDKKVQEPKPAPKPADPQAPAAPAAK